MIFAYDMDNFPLYKEKKQVNILNWHRSPDFRHILISQNKKYAIRYYFRQLEALDFWCIVDNSRGGNDHSKLAGNPNEKYICFCGGMITAPASGDTHICLEMVDVTFYDDPNLIRETSTRQNHAGCREHMEFHVAVSISGTSSFGSTTWFFTITHPLPLHPVYFWTVPLVPIRAAFFVAVSGIFHGKAAVYRADGIAINVVTDFFKSTLIS